jgi:hypothetical protein
MTLSESEVSKPQRSSRTRVLVALGVGLLPPLLLMLALNFLRPDLMTPFLSSELGHSLIQLESFLVVAGTLCFLGAALGRFKGRTGPVLLWVAGLLGGSVPALFLILFGPIVTAVTGSR